MESKIDSTDVMEVKGAAIPSQPENRSFQLDKTEEQLLEEFGVLMAAEYGYCAV